MIDYDNFLTEVLDGRPSPFKSQEEYHQFADMVFTDEYFGVQDYWSIPEEERDGSFKKNLRDAIEVQISWKVGGRYTNTSTYYDYPIDEEIPF